MAGSSFRRITLRGAVCGEIWWPAGAKCGRPVTYKITRDTPIYDEIESLLGREGDFQGAPRLTADSVIEIEDVEYGTGRKHSHVRFVEVGTMPSLAALVDAHTFSGDFAA